MPAASLFSVPPCILRCLTVASLSLRLSSFLPTNTGPKVLRLTSSSDALTDVLDDSVCIETLAAQDGSASAVPGLFEKAWEAWQQHVHMSPACLAADARQASPVHICGRVENKAFCLASQATQGTDAVYMQLALSGCSGGARGRQALLYLRTNAARPLLGVLPGARIIVYNVRCKAVRRCGGGAWLGEPRGGVVVSFCL